MRLRGLNKFPLARVTKRYKLIAARGLRLYYRARLYL